MSPKKQQGQSMLNLPRNRRNTKQQQSQHHKSIGNENTIQIGKQRQNNATTTYITNEKVGIHQDHLDNTNKLLRAFDLNYAFGPCVGIIRLDRWERAQNLGLNPPTIVREVLMKDKAGNYKNCVFHQFRMI
ncbi:hypothetical protein INT46_002637 [Mucor plumbeus]|uniref:DNA polymerase delta subunit 4 n=1 Tax=Mucor plumbeus TaxID=97098 RepID=A0A8H7QQM9_9FUNG|nr:hypothetical protein INT46_002637 [Mucor plumbeus]